jgi:NADPH:quinone reductase-like Zn-dependent oxidoreductase
MKAVWINQFGGHEVICVGERAVPERKSGELLIRMTTATLNHHDIYLRRGEAGLVFLPVILGSDGAGEVVGADSSSHFVYGDRVVIYSVLACQKCHSCLVGQPHKCSHFGMIGGERNGTQADYVVVPESCAIPIPDGVDFDTAAAVSLAGLTAWNMVVDEGVARSGEHALVLGGSGGVGVFTVSLLKWLGLNVHVVTSSPKKREVLLALGADTVLDASPSSVLEFTRSLPNGGVDIAFNWVGGSSWRYVPPAVRAGGRILVCGSLRSPTAELDMRQIFYRNISLIGCSMGTPEALHKFLQFIVATPEYCVPLSETITLDEVPDAHQRMEAGLVSGKIIIRIR